MSDPIKYLVICKWCNNKLSNPIFLPCGQTVCGKHQDEIKNSICDLCNQEHKLGKNESFPENKLVEQFLNSGIDKLGFGESFVEAKRIVNELKNVITEYENTLNNPSNVISIYFKSVKNKIDLKREELIEKINESCEMMIKHVENREKFYIEKIKKKEENPFEKDLLVIKNDLKEWDEKLKSSVIDQEMWNNIKTKSTIAKDEVEKQLKMFNDQVKGKRNFDDQYSDENIRLFINEKLNSDL